MQALGLFALMPTGFRHREFRDHAAQLQQRDAATYSAGSITDDLAPPSIARPHRTRAAPPSVPHHTDRRPRRDVLRPAVYPSALPGDAFEEFLKPMGIGQVEAARQREISLNRLNEVVLEGQGEDAIFLRRIPRRRAV